MFLIAASFFILISSFPAAIDAKEVVRLATGEWPPFISETLEDNGLMAQVTREAFANVEIDVQFGFFPWVRAYEMSKSGDWDGTIAFVRLKEREKFYYYSDPLYTGKYVFFHLKSFSMEWTNYDDLKSLTFATTRGYGGMGDKFLEEERAGNIKVLRLNSDIQSYGMLLSHRVQAVPSDMEVGYVYLHKFYKKDLEKFTHHPKAIQIADYHLVISKKLKNGPALIAKFNEGLRRLHKSGRYKEILKTWYSKPIYKDSIPAPVLSKLIKEQLK